MAITGRIQESATRADIAAWQAARLAELLATVIPANRFWTRKFADAGIDPASIHSLGGLARLPFTTKQELAQDQQAAPPYGTNLTFPVTAYSRLHQTSGTTTGRPLRWLDTPASWQWMLDCWSTIYRLAGLRADDRL